MSQPWWTDDDQLLAALGAALRSERTVPAGFISMGKAAFWWPGIHAELAALTEDPAADGAETECAGVRPEPASPRHLTVTSRELTIEIVVTDDAILGQIAPPGPGRVQARTAEGTIITGVIGQDGSFTIIRPDPPGPFRLYCHATNGTGVLTHGLMLQDPPSH